MQRQVYLGGEYLIIWADLTSLMWLFDGHLEINFSGIWIKAQKFSYENMNIKTVSAKQPFCLSIHVVSDQGEFQYPLPSQSDYDIQSNYISMALKNIKV